ncbi:MAG TPA: DUF6340 family protein [Bacteroidales bacterium]|nr:DUF6340 family protein [Bacteroidales bacterium]
MPGEVEFPSDVNSLSLVLLKNEFNMPEGRLDSIDNIRLDPEFNYYQFAREYLYGLQHTLQESPRFDNIVITDLTILDSLGYEPEFDWREIIRICRNDSTDAMILMVNFFLDDSLIVSNSIFEKYFEELVFGNVVKYQLTNKLFYVVVNPRIQEITDKQYVKNENAWYGFDLLYEDALEQLPDGADMILQSCYETGQKAGLMMAPAWKDDIHRIYYTRGNKLLISGASFAKQDMWREAAGYWRMAADSKKKKASAKAAFNMALVCEIEDKIDLAREWIARSDSLRSNEFSMLYQQILQARLEYRTMLNKQMGIEE